MTNLYFIKSKGALVPIGAVTEQWANNRHEGSRVLLVTKEAKRSLDQNSMINAMYSQIAGAVEQTPMEVRHYCKLHHGVPILRRDDEDFRTLYDKTFKDILSYEDKLAAMKYLPVTRLMSKAQCSEYTDNIIADFTDQGVPIILPGDRYD